MADNTKVSTGSAQTETERAVAGIVGSVLGIPSVGIDESFFEMGGTSALLIQVHQRLETAFSREIPVVEIFNHPSVRALAAYLDQQAGGPVAGESQAEPEDRSAQLKQGRDRLKRRLNRKRQA